MMYDVKTRCQNCGEVFVLHQCLAFEYPDDPNFVGPTKEELEKMHFVENAIGEKAYCENCREIGGIVSRKFWIPFADVDNEFLSAITIGKFDMPIDKKIGVYLIVYPDTKLPNFVYPSPAGWFKGQDPSISIETLKNKWVDGAKILYIGRAMTEKNNLRHRIKKHIVFWGGKPVAARGGRIIAQIKGYKKLEIWYMECADPKRKETELIDMFKESYGGKLPFANWKSGDE